MKILGELKTAYKGNKKKKQNKTRIGVFLQKALDTMDHSIYISKLQTYGVLKAHWN